MNPLGFGHLALPAADSRGIVVPGDSSRGGVLYDWQKFLGEYPKDATPEQITRWNTTPTLPSAFYDKPLDKLTRSIFRYHGDRWNDMWISRICNTLMSDSLSFTVNTFHYDSSAADLVPIGGVNRHGGSRSSSREHHFGSYSRGFQLYNAVLMSPDGMKMLSMEMRRIADALTTRFKYLAIEAMLNSRGFSDWARENNYFGRFTVEQYFQRMQSRWDIVKRGVNGLERLCMLIDGDTIEYDVTTSVLIMPLAVQNYVTHSPENMDAGRAGPADTAVARAHAGFRNRYDTNRPIASVAGNRVYCLTPFVHMDGRREDYLLESMAQAGELFYHYVRPGIYAEPEAYTTRDTHIKIFDETADNYVELTAADAIANCPAFDHLQPPGDVTHPGHGGHGGHGDHEADAREDFLARMDESTGRLVPVRLVGEIRDLPVGHVSFAAAAMQNALCSVHGDRQQLARTHEVFAAGMSLLAELEGVEFTRDWFDGFAALNVLPGQTEAPPRDRIYPVPANLRQLRAEPDTGSYRPPTDANGRLERLPFGMANLWGLRQLARASAAPGDTKMQRAIDTARDFVELMDRFAGAISRIAPDTHLVEALTPIALRKRDPAAVAFLETIANTSLFVWVNVRDAEEALRDLLVVDVRAALQRYQDNNGRTDYHGMFTRAQRSARATLAPGTAFADFVRRSTRWSAAGASSDDDTQFSDAGALEDLQARWDGIANSRDADNPGAILSFLVDVQLAALWMTIAHAGAPQARGFGDTINGLGMLYDTAVLHAAQRPLDIPRTNILSFMSGRPTEHMSAQIERDEIIESLSGVIDQYRRFATGDGRGHFDDAQVEADFDQNVIQPIMDFFGVMADPNHPRGFDFGAIDMDRGDIYHTQDAADDGFEPSQDEIGRILAHLRRHPGSYAAPWVRRRLGQYGRGDGLASAVRHQLHFISAVIGALLLLPPADTVLSDQQDTERGRVDALKAVIGAVIRPYYGDNRGDDRVWNFAEVGDALADTVVRDSLGGMAALGQLRATYDDDCRRTDQLIGMRRDDMARLDALVAGTQEEGALYVQTSLTLSPPQLLSLWSYYERNGYTGGGRARSPPLLVSTVNDSNRRCTMAELRDYAALVRGVSSAHERPPCLRTVRESATNALTDFFYTGLVTAGTRARGGGGGAYADPHALGGNGGGLDPHVSRRIFDSVNASTLRAPSQLHQLLLQRTTDRLKLALARVYLLTRVNVRNLSAFCAHNVPLPMEFVISRPWMRYMAYSLVKVADGGKAVTVVRGNPLFTIGNDPNDQRLVGGFSMTGGALLEDPRLVYVANHAMIHTRLGGGDTVYYCPRRQMQDAESYCNPSAGIYGGTEKRTSLIVIPVPVGFCARHSGYMDLTGRFEALHRLGIPRSEHAGAAGASAPPHYPTAYRIRRFYNVYESSTGSAAQSSAPGEPGYAQEPNTLLARGQMWHYNRATGRFDERVSSLSLWGDELTFSGCRRVRDGQAGLKATLEGVPQVSHV